MSLKALDAASLREIKFHANRCAGKSLKRRWFKEYLMQIMASFELEESVNRRRNKMHGFGPHFNAKA